MMFSGTQKIQKSKVLKIKIRSAQIVGEVFFMPEKGVPAPFGAFRGNFFRRPEKSKKCPILPIFLGGPMGPIHPVWGPCCYPPEVGQ